jgi:hypothetical protein
MVSAVMIARMFHRATLYLCITRDHGFLRRNENPLNLVDRPAVIAMHPLHC